MIVHNLKGYDSNLIMNVFNKSDANVSVIPNVLEKYMAFTINKNLVFIDSKQFMNSSLEELTINLSYNDFEYLSQELNPEQLKLAKQKRVYFYKYMVFEKFSEDKLPDKKHFYKSLKNKHIKQKDYLHAVKIQNKFKMKNMGDCHDLYIKPGVMFLKTSPADPQNFKKQIYPYYFSSPGLIWDANSK